LVDGLKLYHFLPKKFRGNWLLANHWEHDERREVPAISGAVMLARMSMIKGIGGFADEFHMYGEDGELCVRVARNDWKIVFEPTAEVFHLGGRSAAQRWGENERHVIEEQAWTDFQVRFQSRPRAFATLAAKSGLILLYLLKNSLSRNSTKLLRQLVGIQFSGMKKILRGQTSNS
jgi:GT2 family glycosyltransferase